MTMKLFAVRHIHSRVPEPGTYPNKPEARAARDALNTLKANQYVITYGPDHRHYTPLH